MLQKQTYQGKQQGPHHFETSGPNAPKWYIVDAEGMVVGRLASVLAQVLTGKHKPTYTRHADTGDFVIVVNADKVVFTRNKWDQKLYRRYTGYMGGLKTQTARELLERKPEEVLKKAVWGMINHTPLGTHQFAKLKVYAGSEHPHQAQQPQSLPAWVSRKTVLESKKV